MKDRNGRKIEVGDCAFVAESWTSGKIRYEFGVFKVTDLVRFKEPSERKRDMAYLQSMGDPMSCWQEIKDIVSMTEDEAVFYILKNETRT